MKFLDYCTNVVVVFSFRDLWKERGNQFLDIELQVSPIILIAWYASKKMNYYRIIHLDWTDNYLVQTCQSVYSYSPVDYWTRFYNWFHIHYHWFSGQWNDMFLLFDT